MTAFPGRPRRFLAANAEMRRRQALFFFSTNAYNKIRLDPGGCRGIFLTMGGEVGDS